MYRVERDSVPTLDVEGSESALNTGTWRNPSSYLCKRKWVPGLVLLARDSELEAFRSQARGITREISPTHNVIICNICTNRYRRPIFQVNKVRPTRITTQLILDALSRLTRLFCERLAIDGTRLLQKSGRKEEYKMSRESRIKTGKEYEYVTEWRASERRDGMRGDEWKPNEKKRLQK